MSSNRILAESALLGAVLADPPAHQHLLDIVQAADFERPWHVQVLAAMNRLRARAVLPGALAVYEEIQKDGDVPATVARDGVVLANLIEASPRPAHARAYAAMVVESGIRQQLDLAGARLAQASETGDLGAALDQAGQTSVVIGACRSRWFVLPDVVSSQLPAVPRWQPVQQIRIVARAGRTTTSRSALRARELEAAKPAAAQPSPVSPAQHKAVAHLDAGPDHGDASAEIPDLRALRDLVAAPSAIARVRGWLRPEHFTLPEHGQLYAVMRDLHASRQPVDPLTVAWEASRRGITADPASMCGGTGAFAVASARNVCRHGTLARIERAGLGIQADSADAALSPPRLLQSAGTRIHNLEPELSRDRHLLLGIAVDRDADGYLHSAHYLDREAGN